MSRIQEAQDRLGELFIIGFEGTSLSEDTAAFLSQAKIGAVILFKHNYENPEQVAELITQIQECRTQYPLWVSVDQEGGRVQRFKDPFTLIPPAALIGKCDSPKLAFDVSVMMATELKAVGINLNFAPICDIHSNPNNPIIGDRAFSDNEEIVSKMVTAFVRGHLTTGVHPCVKHFPGHGDTDKDSHLELPTVKTALETLRQREFRPFVKAFKSRAGMVMTAHILLPELDSKYPATLSKKILQDLLRKELRYSRVIVSDDMEMQAITDHYGPEEGPLLAFQAGCDVLIYRSEGAARKAYSSLIRALEDGKLAPELILQAAERAESLKKDFLKDYELPKISEIKNKVGIPGHQELIQKIQG